MLVFLLSYMITDTKKYILLAKWKNRHMLTELEIALEQKVKKMSLEHNFNPKH